MHGAGATLTDLVALALAGLPQAYLSQQPAMTATPHERAIGSPASARAGFDHEHLLYCNVLQMMLQRPTLAMLGRAQGSCCQQASTSCHTPVLSSLGLAGR
jgi:hypothetical protein